MNKFLYLLTQNKALNFRVSAFTEVFFTTHLDKIDVEFSTLNTKPQKLFDASLGELKSILSSPKIQAMIDRDFNDALDLHYEKKSSLSHMLTLLDHKDSILPQNKKILSSLFKLTTETENTKLCEGVSLKLLTSCGKTARAGYDLHFQIHLEPEQINLPSKLGFDGEQTHSPSFSSAQTLAFLHKMLLSNKEQILENLKKQNMLQQIKNTQKLTEYTKLKNRFLAYEEKIEK